MLLKSLGTTAVDGERVRTTSWVTLWAALAHSCLESGGFDDDVTSRVR